MKFNFNSVNDINFIKKEIDVFTRGRRRAEMTTAARYFDGEHDILKRRRTGIGEGGRIEEIENLPNNRVVDNIFRKLVIQKSNYILGRPLVFDTDKNFAEILSGHVRTDVLRELTQDSYIYGAGWLFVNYDERGELVQRRVAPTEIIPGWHDRGHTALDYVIRIFENVDYTAKNAVTHRAEVYDDSGVHTFVLDRGNLTPCEPYHRPYFTVTDACNLKTDYAWEKIPFIPFRVNGGEKPLLYHVKSLQDGLNQIISNFWNVMEEDGRNSIMVLVNYDGENLGEFRRNLAAYGAVKVRTVDGAPGDLKTLSVNVKSENYKTLAEMFRKAIYETGMAYDGRDERTLGSPNRMNIAAMYSDMDLDANEAEQQLSKSVTALVKMIACHTANTVGADYTQTPCGVIFNRDMIVNESEVIDNCVKSKDILTEEEVRKNHPWL